MLTGFYGEIWRKRSCIEQPGNDADHLRKWDEQKSSANGIFGQQNNTTASKNSVSDIKQCLRAAELPDAGSKNSPGTGVYRYQHAELVKLCAIRGSRRKHDAGSGKTEIWLKYLCKILRENKTSGRQSRQPGRRGEKIQL